MLKIYKSLDLKYLCNELKNKLVQKENWKNPFLAPEIIFADSKIEQWFKITWIQNRTGNNPVLMNLKTSRLEQFLFDQLTKGIEGDVYYERLTEEFLRDYLIQKLISKVDDQLFYKTLNSPEVSAYLEKTDADGKVEINEIHLYDFAQRTARLFMDYETTRCLPFVEAWKSEKTFYFNPSDEKGKKTEEWQKKLYNSVFNPVIKKENEYVTITQLAQINKSKNGGKLKFKESKVPVYFFGFTGMGQIYRDLIKVYAECQSIPVTVFIQGENYSENEIKNPLLQKWLKSGSENLALWQEKLSPQQIVSQDKFPEPESDLQKIQNEILNNRNTKDIYSHDNSLTLTHAPSRLREIEQLHSKICGILKEYKDAGKKINYSDFLVLAPDIQEYAVPVQQVFEQNDRNSESDFPHLPYIIADYAATTSSTDDALQHLISILQKNSLSRADMFYLFGNPVVQNTRKIQPGDVSSWSQWVTNLNGYRDRTYKKNEWKKICARILLSRVTDCPVVVDEENQYIPYANISTEDNDVLYRFVAAVDELEDWKDRLAVKKELTREDVLYVREFFDKWLKIDTKTSRNLSGEQIVYSSICHEINNQLMLLEEGTTINASCFFFGLSACSKNTKGTSSSVFSNGITFANLAQNRIIPAEYVFVLGMNSKNFPGQDSKNVLDLRNMVQECAGDEQVAEKNKNSFLCQLMASGKGFYISYVNQDLKNDEEFYRSSVVNDLFETVLKPGQKITALEKEIKIDENRSWSELYTQREFRNKKNFKEIENPQIHLIPPPAPVKVKDCPDRMSISRFKSYLTDPFVFSIETLFSNSDEDEEAEELIQEQEPLEFDNLQKSKLITGLIRNRLDPDYKIEADKQLLKNQNLLPDVCFGELAYTEIENKANMFSRALMNDFNCSELVFNRNSDVLVEQVLGEDGAEETKKWQLTGELCWYCWSEDETELKVITTSNGSGIPDVDKFLKQYISALSLLAARKNEGPCNAVLYCYFIKDEQVQSKTKVLEIHTKSEAMELLKQLYKAACYEKHYACVPVKLLKKAGEISNISELAETLYGKYGSWAYFKKQKFFNPFEDLHYTSRNFRFEWAEAVARQESLIKLL